MRSPGCCTNHEACWLGNGQRIIRVPIGDAFCCPVCGSDLVPPHIETITQTGVRRAVATSLALILAAGGSGFGLVKLLHLAGLGGLSASAPVVVATQGTGARPHAAFGGLYPAPGAPAPRTIGAAVPHAAISAAPAATPAGTANPASVAGPTAGSAAVAAPPGAAPTIVVLGTCVLQPPSRVLLATNVSQEPLRPLTLPISFGLPEPPEDDTPAPAQRWRSRIAVAAQPRNELLPAPGVEDVSMYVPSPAVAGAEPAFQAASGEAALPAGEGDATPEVVAADASPQPQVIDDTYAARGGLPTVQPDTAPPAAVAESGMGWSSVSRALQPKVDEPPQDEPAVAAVDNLPAARVDPAVAQQLDAERAPPRRLATLPPAPPEKLAVPAYPPVQAEIERPGRVDVGCVITPHGLPAGCRVERELGGPQFADSVLTWLHSGAVRYRPHLAHGKPVPEPRTYKVRFEP